MRVSSISSINQISYPLRTSKNRTHLQNTATSQQNIDFKGWKAGLGSLGGGALGALAGLGLTVITGGAALPFLIGGGGLGMIAGGAAGSSKEDPVVDENGNEVMNDLPTNYNNY